MSQLELTPHGIVLCRDDSLKELAGFGDSEAAGLIRIAGQKLPPEVDASVHYWKGFAEHFIRSLCHVSPENETDLQIEPPAPADLSEIILNAPPMRGAEYLSLEVLRALWQRLIDWTRAQLETDTDLTALLASHAPLWSRVGRVTLHLAENKSDPEYPFAFMASYASGLSKSGRLQQLPLGKALKEYAGTNNKSALLKLLSPINTAAKQCKLIADLVETQDIFHPLVWLPSEAFQFLQSVPELEDAGLLIRLPDWWKKRTRRPQVAAKIGSAKRSSVGEHGLLDVKLNVIVDGQALSAEEIEALLDGDDGLVLLRGQWVEVDREKLQQALDHWRRVEAHGEISFAEGMRWLAGAPADLAASSETETFHEWAFAEPGEALAELLQQLKDPAQLTPPGTLLATLRPYQQAGLDWLWFCTQTGLGACLADDMGLGKTIQLLAALLRKQQQSPKSTPALLVVPASLIGNWQREADKFAPSLRLFVAHPSECPKDILHSTPTDQLAHADLVITTYGMLNRLDWPAEFDWSWVVLDEAQAIKNHATRQSKAVRALKAQARIALTGTPIENTLGDLWSLFDFINPGLLGSSGQFAKFTKDLSKSSTDHFAPLRRLVSPYILRRLKTDKSIIGDLPDKTEMKVFCGLSVEQAKLYQHTVKTLKEELATTEGIQRKGLVLSYLMRFKQICNHPDQLTGAGEYIPKQSAKFQRLEELATQIESRGEKLLIFTQFREMTDPLADCLAAIFGRSGLVLHGGTPIKQRQQMVDHFQREDGPPFFVLSLKAGGTGLNLTAASHVVHFDRWWNPAIENQATDRAFRIGQKRNVLVHKFVTSGTLEEKIDRMIAEKQSTADQLLTGSAEKTLTELSNDELLDLIRLDLQHADTKL
ncbi:MULTISPECIES: DEAD/DEAH box helicase [unclassified Lentimonas]|uniref:DEAD/DEAH box helicase n=1 Tax=unclassified Lentimonas TaxID=2630993 RepID=UPI00132BFC54|nr:MULTISPECIES: DEAD/DEAH box helicase [unclassified Lentimonas]CAA6694122.1 Helicase, SNF2/RAD54 family [Lentimonas sp. CC19]CAA6694381.1 Helicase, SNF2/RAD54 family [Lentimonas sp. CC10]CAA7070353.1 Helicase, SNF2/RAD54 family [Lentimonas sp. CC11]